MRHHRWTFLCIGFLLVLLSAVIAVHAAQERSSSASGQQHAAAYPTMGIYLDLTEAFNSAMQYNSSNRTLSTNMSEDYLHQIAIATRYTVETNLQILKQQERIIQLLEKTAGKNP